MYITILAQTTSTNSNAPGGAILTFAFPIILFAVIAAVLYYLLFARPHPRVPSRRIALARVTPGAPEPGAAHASAVAAGFPTASGGGATESATEPAGAKRDTLAEAADDGATTTGSVSGGAANTGAANTGAANTGAANTGAANTGAANTEAANTEAANGSAGESEQGTEASE